METLSSESTVEALVALLTFAMSLIFAIVSFIADRGYLETHALERRDEMDTGQDSEEGETGSIDEED
eukprot:2357789-Alexandrium_andersonii.AAC.1